MVRTGAYNTHARIYRVFVFIYIYIYTRRTVYIYLLASSTYCMHGACTRWNRTRASYKTPLHRDDDATDVAAAAPYKKPVHYVDAGPRAPGDAYTLRLRGRRRRIVCGVCVRARKSVCARGSVPYGRVWTGVKRCEGGASGRRFGRANSLRRRGKELKGRTILKRKEIPSKAGW